MFRILSLPVLNQGILIGLFIECLKVIDRASIP
jgi:hypothetical protein